MKTNKKKHWAEYLKELGACKEGVKWARRFKTPAEAWKKAPRTYVDWVISEFLPGYDSPFEFCSCDYCYPDTETLKSMFPIPTVGDLKFLAKEHKKFCVWYADNYKTLCDTWYVENYKKYPWKWVKGRRRAVGLG